MLQNYIGEGSAPTRVKISVVLQDERLRVLRKRQRVAFGEEGVVPAELLRNSLQFLIRDGRAGVQLQVVQVLLVVIFAQHGVLCKLISRGDWRRVGGQRGGGEGVGRVQNSLG